MKLFIALVATATIACGCSSAATQLRSSNMPTPSYTGKTPSWSSPTPIAQDGVLPIKSRTPGATNPDVTQETIHSTICVSGWTSTVRPSSNYTGHLKLMQLQTGYAYNGDMNPKDYEEDHLISLELGGSPMSPKNLWPEPYHSAEGARIKDRVENKLNDLVCAGTITLKTAQHAVAVNWWAAYQKYVS